MSHCWCHSTDVTLLQSFCWWHRDDDAMLMILCWCHYYWCHYIVTWDFSGQWWNFCFLRSTTNLISGTLSRWFCLVLCHPTPWRDPAPSCEHLSPSWHMAYIPILTPPDTFLTQLDTFLEPSNNFLTPRSAYMTPFDTFLIPSGILLISCYPPLHLWGVKKKLWKSRDKLIEAWLPSVVDHIYWTLDSEGESSNIRHKDFHPPSVRPLSRSGYPPGFRNGVDWRTLVKG